MHNGVLTAAVVSAVIGFFVGLGAAVIVICCAVSADILQRAPDHRAPGPIDRGPVFAT